MAVAVAVRNNRKKQLIKDLDTVQSVADTISRVPSAGSNTGDATFKVLQWPRF